MLLGWPLFIGMLVLERRKLILKHVQDGEALVIPSSHHESSCPPPVTLSVFASPPSPRQILANMSVSQNTGP